MRGEVHAYVSTLLIKASLVTESSSAILLFLSLSALYLIRYKH